MKKGIIAFLVCLMLFTVIGCTPGDNGGGGDKNITVDEDITLLTLDEVVDMIGNESTDVGNYGVDTIKKYISPLWKSQIIYNESAFFVADKQGNAAPLGLSYKAARILSVRKSTALSGAAYAEGADYTLDASGRLALPSDSSIPVMPFSAYFPTYANDNDTNNWYYKHADGSKTGIINSSAPIRPYELAVTYIRTDAFGGEKPKSQLAALTGLIGKDTGTLNILFVGDSVIAGAGPSNTNAPNVPPYPDMVAQGWAAYTERTAKPVTGVHQIQSGAVNYLNGGVPGITAMQYKYVLDDNVSHMLYASDYTKGEAAAKVQGVLAMLDVADVVIIGLGANDGGGWDNGVGSPAGTFKLNMGIVIDKIRAANPSAAVVLVAPHKTHDNVYTDAALTVPLFGVNAAQYETALSELVADYTNIAVVKSYGVQLETLKSKPISNLIADGRNHPNDFLSRIFAQTVLTTVLKPNALEVYPVRNA
ncbi:MAG: SGNH/GDSL hydrolase family protein [Clostridiales bacterium]|jgi:lysophospholipase L1-like esterase|nr:SGNH/GDSL hydrolase family protein [Clostridiales bacterium]